MATWGRVLARCLFALLLMSVALSAAAQTAPRAVVPGGNEKWATVWAASAHGPYPAGNANAQPDQRFAFPVPEAGARDQTFRLMLKPEFWGKAVRLRFSNVFGDRPLNLDGIHVGLQNASSSLVPGTNRAVTFGGKAAVSIPPGQMMWSDGITLPFFSTRTVNVLSGRRLAVSFHVAGQSGPMTWHAKAINTSYVSAPGAGARGAEEGEAGFPYSTASWFFLDAVDMIAPARAQVVVALGDSITDGTNSTMNGDDRWPDVLGRRLRTSVGPHVAVVNAGIGGNQVIGPAEYSAARPVNGGPSALARLERDVFSLSGVTTVVWLEGINDFGSADAPAEAVAQGLRQGVARLRGAIPGVRIVGATLTSALNSTPTHGRVEVDARRQALNAMIRGADIFDAVVDFDAATRDVLTGEIRPDMQPNSTIGGPGDKLHPNRAGLLAMGGAVDPKLILPAAPPPRR